MVPGNPFTRMNIPEMVFPMEGQYYPQLSRRSSTRHSRMGLAGPPPGSSSGKYGTFVSPSRRSRSRQPRYPSTDSESEGYDQVRRAPRPSLARAPQPELVRVREAEVPIHEGNYTNLLHLIN